MCTVTIIATERGFRLISNRDELRTRPRSTPPQTRTLASGARAAWPTDALAGGTWIGASEHGLVMTLLNGNPSPPLDLPPKDQLRSRGLIIPEALGANTADQAVGRLDALDLTRFAPFRLVAVDREQIVDAVWDRTALEISRRELEPTCFVSSGLGDALVAPRLELFEQWMRDHSPTRQSQSAFHEHAWEDRRPLSVLMDRPDARTVAITAIEVVEDANVEIEHHDLLADGAEARVHCLSLSSPAGAARGA